MSEETSKSTVLRMDAFSIHLPKYDPINPRGEDSHFISLSAKTIGIADGFGGWETRTGAEKGQFGRMLMQRSELAVRNAIQNKEDIKKIRIRKASLITKVIGRLSSLMISSADAAVCKDILMGDIHPKEILKRVSLETNVPPGSSAITHCNCKPIQMHPKKILQKAYSETKVPGSSTACLITLSGNILRAVNVGDSGFVIVRDGRVIYRSPVQLHGFNNPYLLRMGNPNNNTRLAEEIEVMVELGDVIIAGTDGLFCNMHEAHLEDVMRESKKLGLSLKKIASVIAKLAERNSLDTRAETPFSRAAKAAGYDHRGGKIDDITVVVAVIRPSMHELM